jgi:hypothetical protein
MLRRPCQKILPDVLLSFAALFLIFRHFAAPVSRFKFDTEAAFVNIIFNLDVQHAISGGRP